MPVNPDPVQTDLRDGGAVVQRGDRRDGALVALARVPRVSIGMPVFNGMAFIERSVRSLLDQTFTDFELIIVDNASTDGSYEFACSLGDPRLRVVRNDQNIGAFRNFLKARDLGRGEYFMWAAVDDFWEPEFVARMANELDKHPEAGVAMCASRRMRADGVVRDEIRFSGADDPTGMSPLQLAMGLGSLRKYNLFVYGLFRRSLFQRLTVLEGPLERIPLTELALAASFRYVDESLYNRQMHEQKYYKRYPNEEFGRAVAMGFLGDLQFLGMLLLSLLRSRVIPIHRKILIPVVVARFAVTRVYARFIIPAQKKRAQEKRAAEKAEQKRAAALAEQKPVVAKAKEKRAAASAEQKPVVAKVKEKRAAALAEQKSVVGNAKQKTSVEKQPKLG